MFLTISRRKKKNPILKKKSILNFYFTLFSAVRIVYSHNSSKEETAQRLTVSSVQYVTITNHGRTSQFSLSNKIQIASATQSSTLGWIFSLGWDFFFFRREIVQNIFDRGFPTEHFLPTTSHRCQAQNAIIVPLRASRDKHGRVDAAVSASSQHL